MDMAVQEGLCTREGLPGQSTLGVRLGCVINLCYRVE